MSVLLANLCADLLSSTKYVCTRTAMVYILCGWDVAGNFQRNRVHAKD